MKIYFVRHGESLANLRGEISNRGLSHGLTPKGRAQIEHLAECLQGLPVRRIFSSPLLRAIETSEILAQRLNADYVVVSALREFDCGILEGRSDETSWVQWQELFEAWMENSQWERRIDGGENFYQLQDRFIRFLRTLIQRYQKTGGQILCVGHGGLFRLMLPHILIDWEESNRTNRDFEPGSAMVSEWRQERLFYSDWVSGLVDIRIGSVQA